MPYNFINYRIQSGHGTYDTAYEDIIPPDYYQGEYRGNGLVATPKVEDPNSPHSSPQSVEESPLAAWRRDLLLRQRAEGLTPTGNFMRDGESVQENYSTRFKKLLHFSPNTRKTRHLFKDSYFDEDEIYQRDHSPVDREMRKGRESRRDHSHSQSPRKSVGNHSPTKSETLKKFNG